MERRIGMLSDELLPSLNGSLSKLGTIFTDYRFPHIQDCEGFDTRARENVLDASVLILSQLQAVFESVENVYRSDFDRKAWRGIKQNLFPEEIPEHFAVIKYDVKVSTRDDESLKKKRWMVRDINRRLIPRLSEETTRGTIIEVAHPHEDGLFLAKTEHDIARLVLGLLRVAEENGKRLRLSICLTQDTGVPFMRKREYFYDDEYQLITWEEEDQRAGINIDLNYALAARLLEMAESREDREEKKGEEVILGLGDSVHTLIFSEAAAKAFGFDAANDARLATGSVAIPKKEGRDYRGFVLLPAHFHVVIEKFEQRL
jgi:hypothetical protein